MKLEQAARQALEVFWMIGTDDISMEEWNDAEKAKAALQEALAEQAEQEPVHWVVPDFGFLFPSEDAAKRYLANIESDAKPTPCCAVPVRTKDLTDDEIYKLADDVDWAAGAYLGFARAVIAAYREKNR